jgi:endothelin-converting enzyme/putative endopeptidase
VRNLDEFHEVFETSEQDGLWLHPSERVRIW